ncbi:uncharacterized protein [Montipora capricornis]|uniref:uncharacterized protein isoform X1 n=1 Tax=Montipora capricornis TaxID=246305 RepID=UPI0035F18120
MRLVCVKMLVCLILCSFLPASTQALIDMKERLKDRVVHVETLIHRGRWLWQNDNKDRGGSKYLWIDLIAERDTYYEPRVQFQTTACAGGKYLCFEPLSLPNYYLTAGHPTGASKYTVKLQHSTYVDNDNRFHWKVMCENDKMEKCKFVPVRFESEGWLMVADNWGNDWGHDGGHYDATLGKDVSKAWFRVHAPNPTDGYHEVYSNTNLGTTEQQAEYSTTIGVSQTQTRTHTITNTVSVEIGGAFKAFSASASASIEESWQYASSSTFEAAKTVTHKIKIPGRTKVVLKQLIGKYADMFDVGDDKYQIDEIPLDGGAARKKRIRLLKPTFIRA